MMAGPIWYTDEWWVSKVANQYRRDNDNNMDIDDDGDGPTNKWTNKQANKQTIGWPSS